VERWLQTSGFRKKTNAPFFIAFNVFSTLKEGVARGGELLPKADIASSFRRRGGA
jgi:hypothetical protein